MSKHTEQERRTARMVRAAYGRYVAPGRATAEQLHALCMLTWITKGGANLEHGLPDNTRAVVAPALRALTGADITATELGELPEQLSDAKAPIAIVRLAATPLGFVNFYGAFRRVSLKWIAGHLREVRTMAQLAASASNDSEARRAYGILDRVPPIAGTKAHHMPAASLITPMLACLDPRGRSPIINSRKDVQKRLQLLGLRHATVRDQFDGLVNLIGQAGIRDAFDLDTSNVDIAAKLKASTRARADTPHTRLPGDARPLSERDDADVEFFRRSRSVTMQRVHHTMTNALRRFCKGRGLALKEGASPTCMFDALILEHGGDRHLLVEVKTDCEQATCRLAIGQLLDYRRQLDNRARIDLAVLFPGKPSPNAKAFLDDVGVRPMYFNDARTVVKGL